MKLSIYEVYVPIEDQPQADRMKKICIDYGLPYWDSVHGFNLLKSDKKSIFCYMDSGEFYIYDYFDLEPNDKQLNYTQVTESEFLELVKINFANSK